jgi:hypothetical protein
VATAEWLKFFTELAELAGADKEHVRKLEYLHAPAAASQFRLEQCSHQEPQSIAKAIDPASFATAPDLVKRRPFVPSQSTQDIAPAAGTLRVTERR